MSAKNSITTKRAGLTVCPYFYLWRYNLWLNL
nr:MAG TPA: hypothetical protein [Bacteriophage sp.]